MPMLGRDKSEELQRSRRIAISLTLLTLVFLAHFAGGFTQIGGAQVAPSIAIYVLMALILSPQVGWLPLLALALATGVLTMLATLSPYPLVNIPAHGIGFLVAAGLTRKLAPGASPLSIEKIVLILGLTLVVAWSIFSIGTWYGVPPNHPLHVRSFDFMGRPFGQGVLAWWSFGFLTIAIPSFLIGLVLTPLLYRAIRPSLSRRGMLPD
jgi:hypothetical protein